MSATETKKETLSTRGYATQGPTSNLEPFDFERRQPGPQDILIEIRYCGICHSDIHQARDEWGGSIFPMVPGHEIVGRVTRTGSEVTKFKEGDIAGVGCFVDSCRVCSNCKEGSEQYCENHLVVTYNGTEKDEKTPTYGGYSSQIVVDEDYALRIPDGLPLANVAPLLCAGITTYSPLRRFKVGPGQRVGVVGLGGLGHMAVKFAASMGSEVTVFSTSPSKENDAKTLGAQKFVVTKGVEDLEPVAGKFDFIIDTVSANHDLNLYLNLLRREGAMILVGVPEKPAEVAAFSLISNGRILAGSMIGGIRETQEMLDYCAANNITSDVEIIPIQRIDEAYERTIKGDVRYRFVIDMKSLES
ncbi:MAG TPA: NAD(P)-dependent alcohol dehydrogenase [Pyrinomonadaceae bacterium]|nr:NAD(P)-dependent alcohol dehydrogenase [Pyrinomonadaceae bacterium]